MNPTSVVCAIGFIVGLLLLAFSSQSMGEKTISLDELQNQPLHSRVALTARVQSVYVQSHYVILTLSNGYERETVFLKDAHLLQSVQKNELVIVHGLIVSSKNGSKSLEAYRVDAR